MIKIKSIIQLLFFLFSSLLLAQKEGFWDKERSTLKEIVVPARNRILVKIDDLPLGTTEIIFRITLLDKNQQMANSLVSLLKAIPDPTGISQGSAGAVFLLSKISGEDKCKYAIFTKDEIAKKYQLTGNTSEACWKQEEPVSKDVKRLTVDNSSCLFASKTNELWFGFESTNWIMNQKMVVEIVPWVNYKLSRGWSKDKRKAIIDACKTSNLAQKLQQSNDFCVCVSEKIQSKFTSNEFQKLLNEERLKAYKDFGNSCYEETGSATALNTDLRVQATKLASNGQFGEAISKMNLLINSAKGTALDYNWLGYYYLMTKQYVKALNILKEAEKRDASELLIQLNLAHAYLLNGNYKLAKKIHKSFYTQNVTDSLGWVQKTQLDFENFNKRGIQNHDFDSILKLIAQN